MPFEDVDYLKSHSVKESYLFYVDSAKRDKVKFPNPNRYEINFDSPFENVYSLEILDASIPRTQYSVDIHNNKFRYSMDSINWIDVTVPPGDYDSDTILLAINEELNGNIELNFLSAPNYIKNMFVFISKSQFYLDFDVTSTIKITLGFDQIPKDDDKNDDNDFDKYIKYDGYIFNITTTNNRFFINQDLVEIQPGIYNTNTIIQKLINAVPKYIDVKYTNSFEFKSMIPINITFDSLQYESLINVSEYHKKFRIIHDEKVKAYKSHLVNSIKYPYIAEQIGYISDNLNSNSVKIDNTAEYGNTIEQRFEINTNGKINSINIFGFDFNENERKITIELMKIEQGAYTVIYTRSNYSIPAFTNSIVLNDNILKSINLDVSLNYSLVLTTLSDSFTFQLTNGYTKVNKYYKSFPSTLLPSKLSNIDDSNGSLTMSVNILQQVHTVIAPGVYSLIGDRYIILRCPEIEGHLYRSRSYESYTMGLAKFKLATLGYDDTRIDFSGIPPREFHPIGKLKTLTLEFKRPDNQSLYNFRGINHTITFAIRYYSPVQEEKITKSLLAPSYDPNFMKMLQRDSESESESDEN